MKKCKRGRTNELASTQDELLKGQKAMSIMMEEMWTFMQKLGNIMVDANARNSKGKTQFDVAKEVEGNMGVGLKKKLR
jgi:hypothetical protein